MAEQAERQIIIEGLPPVFDEVVNDFIDARHPDHFINKDVSVRLGGVATVGGLAAVIGTWDFAATSIGNIGFSKDTRRDEVTTSMGERIDSIEDQLSRHPYEISVCRESSYGVCQQSEVYDVRTEQGVVAFLDDDISPTDSPSTEDQVLLSGLPAETNGQRTASFDETIINGLNAKTEEYVGTIPDTKPETTSTFTGEFIEFGGSVAIIFAGLAAFLFKRYEHQAKRLATATDKLTDYKKYQEVGDVPRSGRLDATSIKESAAWKPGYAWQGNQKLVPLPRKGGKKARLELRSSVHRLVEAQLDRQEAG